MHVVKEEQQAVCERGLDRIEKSNQNNLSEFYTVYFHELLQQRWFAGM